MSSTYAEEYPGPDRRAGPDRREGQDDQFAKLKAELDEINEKVSQKQTFWQRWAGTLTLASAVTVPLAAFLFTTYVEFSKVAQVVAEHTVEFSEVREQISKRPTGEVLQLELASRDAGIRNLEQRQDEASKSVDRRLQSILLSVDKLNNKMDRLIEKQIPVK